tara:strand:+ start:561 stop:1112 length:552 start_codon:yes stop_codon:yes gene_type:complete
MNLQENIQRIHQMMGVITEDKKSDFARKMIDTLGLGDAIKYYGSFQNLRKYLNLVWDYDKGLWVPADELKPDNIDLNGFLTREEKIKIIKSTIRKEYEYLFTYGGKGWDESVYSVLKRTESYDKVAFTYYDDGLDITTFYRDKNGEFSSSSENEESSEKIKYEDLPDDMLDNAFDFIIERIQK